MNLNPNDSQQFSYQQQQQQQNYGQQEDMGFSDPLYVNAKQYHRILKRREQRARMEAKYPKARKPYLHESRHKHAMSRMRGPGGRFLTKSEIAEMKIKDEEEERQKKLAEGKNDKSPPPSK